MGFLSLFIVAMMPVLKTLLITAVGLVLALDSVNLLGTVARKNLNKMVFFVFAPSLVFSNLADTITATNIVSLWFMPINILLTFILGSVLGWILVRITRTPQHLEGLVISSCAAGNLGNLLLIIIPAVCNEKNSPFGDSSTCSANGEAYASLSMAVGAVYIWSYIYSIIRAYGSKSNNYISINGYESYIESSEGTDSEALLPNYCPCSEDYENQAELPHSESEDKMKVPFFMKTKLDLKQFAEKINLKMVFAPSTIATIVGLSIGIVSPIRKIVIGDSAQFRVIQNSATLLGEATIPSMTLIVGANLLRGLKRSEVGLWVIIGIQVVRYIALPLLGVVVVKLAHHIGLVGSDALYQFVLLLQYALPTAMTIGTITQLFKCGESECSVIMLWNYALSSLFLTLWSTYYIMGFLSLFIVALMPVLKTLLVSGVGLVLALDRVNILGTVARQNLNKLAFFVFAPSLVFSNLADTITATNIVSLWFMPINILLTFVLGSVLGWILVKITRTPPQLQGLVISFCATGNLGILLLIIIPAVCDEDNSPFGDSTTCSKIGNAYASFSMAVGAVFIWSYIYNLVRIYGSKSNTNTDVNESESGIETSEGTSERISGSCTEALLSKNSTSLEDCEAQAEPPHSESVDVVKVPFFKKINQGLGQFAKTINLKMVLAPSTIATIFGLFVGVVSPIRKIVIGDSAPLRVIKSSATLMGEANVPCVTLIMGANLLRGIKRSELSLWVIIGIQVVRCIVLPLLGIVVVKVAHHIGMVGSDALYQFVLLLQYALPAAMSLGTITQLFKCGERECAVLMLWNYALATLSVTLWSTYFMSLVS